MSVPSLGAAFNSNIHRPQTLSTTTILSCSSVSANPPTFSSLPTPSLFSKLSTITTTCPALSIKFQKSSSVIFFSSPLIATTHRQGPSFSSFIQAQTCGARWLHCGLTVSPLWYPCLPRRQLIVIVVRSNWPRTTPAGTSIVRMYTLVVAELRPLWLEMDL